MSEAWPRPPRSGGPWTGRRTVARPASRWPRASGPAARGVWTAGACGAHGVCRRTGQPGTGGLGPCGGAPGVPGHPSFVFHGGTTPLSPRNVFVHLSPAGDIPYSQSPFPVSPFPVSERVFVVVAEQVSGVNLLAWGRELRVGWKPRSLPEGTRSAGAVC